MNIIRANRPEFYVGIVLLALSYLVSVSHMPQGIADFFIVSLLNVVAFFCLLNALAASQYLFTVERFLALILLTYSAGSVLLLALEVHLRGFANR